MAFRQRSEDQQGRVCYPERHKDQKLLGRHHPLGMQRQAEETDDPEYLRRRDGVEGVRMKLVFSSIKNGTIFDAQFQNLTPDVGTIEFKQ